MMKLEHSGTISILREEDWHLFIEMNSPIVSPLPLQMSIYVEDKAVRTLLFPSPVIINTFSDSPREPVIYRFPADEFVGETPEWNDGILYTDELKCEINIEELKENFRL